MAYRQQTSWTERTAAAASPTNDVDRLVKRHGFHEPHTVLGVLAHWVGLAGTMAPIVIGELVADPAKSRKMGAPLRRGQHRRLSSAAYRSRPIAPQGAGKEAGRVPEPRRLNAPETVAPKLIEIFQRRGAPEYARRAAAAVLLSYPRSLPGAFPGPEPEFGVGMGETSCAMLASDISNLAVTGAEAAGAPPPSERGEPPGWWEVMLLKSLSTQFLPGSRDETLSIGWSRGTNPLVFAPGA
jgi:hypothetical protein